MIADIQTQGSRTLREVLGGSVIADELKGDLTKAASVAREAVEAAGSLDGPAVADARLDLALVLILQGLPGSAIEELNQLPPPDTLAPDLQARCVALHNLAVYVRFNTFPGGEGAGGAHLATLWLGPAYGAEELARWQAVPLDACDPVVALEARLLHDTLCHLKSARTFVVPAPWLSEHMREENYRLAMRVAVELVQSRAHQPSDPVVAFGLFAAADLSRRARDTDGAQSFLNEALSRYDSLHDQAGVGLCWMLLSDRLAAPFSTPLYHDLPVEDVSDFSSAISNELLDVARAASRPDAQAARAGYEHARKSFVSSTSPRGLAGIELREAYLDDLAANFETAISAARSAADRFASAGDYLNAQVAGIHALMHRIHRNPFEWDVETVREVGAWGRHKGSVSWALGLGLLLTAKGRNWIQEQGDGDRAIACYRHAQVLYEALGAEVNVAQSLVDRAEVHRLSSELDACLSLLLQALDRYLDCRDRFPPIRRDIQQRLTRLLEALYWLYAGAIDAEGMARAATRLRHCLEEQPSSDFDAGEQDSGMLDAGDVVLTQARSALRQSAVMVPLYRAKTLADQGFAEEAEPHFQQALKEVDELKGPDKDWLEALVRGTMRDFDGAAGSLERRFEHGAPVVDDTVAMALRVIGRSSGGAARQMQGRLEVEEHLIAFYFLVQMEAFEAAARHLKLVEDRLGSDWWQSEARPWESLVRCAELHAGLNEDERALEDVDRCIKLLEATRGRLLRDTQRTALGRSSVVRNVYTVGIKSAYRLMEKKPHSRRRWLEQTYRYAEAGKARALLDLLVSGEAGKASTAESSWIRTWRELNSRLTTLHALIADEQGRETPNEGHLQHLANREREIEDGLRAHTNTMASANPRFATMLGGRSDISSTEDVVEHLPGNSVLLQYYFEDNELFAWAMDSNGQVELRRAGNDTRKIGRVIREFHAACSSLGDWTTAGTRLSEIFLAPFTKKLDGVDHVVVVPFGPTHRLPFHALPWAGSVLGDTHNLSVLPSGSVARHLQRQERIETAPILAVGDPANMSMPSVPGAKARGLHGLPAAALEARYVASMHTESRALIAEKATVANVKTAISDYQFLHFATHGILNERAPLSSAILLADGEALTAADLLGLRLNADLVVLSGCRTGLGEVTAGDEVIGLTRALLASGAKAAIVSLWPVLDTATSYFMRHFYENLADEGPAGALKRAQAFLRKLTPQQHEEERNRLIHALQDIELSEHSDRGRTTRDFPAVEGVSKNVDYSHPYYWAPFIYVGAA